MIFGLEKVQIRAATSTCAHLHRIHDRLVQAHGKNRYVGLAQLLDGLVQSVFGKSIDAAGQDQNRLFALHIFQAIDRIQDGIEDIRFAKAGKVQTVNCLANFLFVLREVDFHVWPHVKSNQSDPILLREIGEQGSNPILGFVGNPAPVLTAKLHQDNHGDRSFAGSEINQALRNAIFQNTEIFFFQAGNNIPVAGGGDNVESDDWDFDGDGYAGIFGFLLLGSGGSLLLRFRLGLGRRGGLRSVGILGKGREPKKQQGDEPNRAFAEPKRKTTIHEIPPKCYPQYDAN